MKGRVIMRIAGCEDMGVSVCNSEELIMGMWLRSSLYGFHLYIWQHKVCLQRGLRSQWPSYPCTCLERWISHQSMHLRMYVHVGLHRFLARWRWLRPTGSSLACNHNLLHDECRIRVKLQPMGPKAPINLSLLMRVWWPGAWSSGWMSNMIC